MFREDRPYCCCYYFYENGSSGKKRWILFEVVVGQGAAGFGTDFGTGFGPAQQAMGDLKPSYVKNSVED